MAVTTMQAVAGALFLAALAYFLYLWNRRKNMIQCPECGAHIDLYGEECEHCGHKKQETEPVEPVTASVEQDTEDETVTQDTSSVDYDALVQDHTIAEIKDRVDEDDLDLEEVLAAEKRHDDRVTLKDWLEERIEA